jgi:hypothetical protein
MSIRYTRGIGFGFTAAALLALPAWSQDKKEGQDKPTAEATNPEDRVWTEAATPNENHKLLEHFVGNWDVTTKIYMGPEPTVSKGRSTSMMILAGRFVTDEFHGDMMNMPFEGHGVTGYDNIKKKFVGGWVDNMGTGIFVHEGTYDPAKKEFTFLGEFAAPTGGVIKSRMVIVLDNPDQHRTTMYHTVKDQPEMKVMELVYNRAKGGDKPAGGGGMGGGR